MPDRDSVCVGASAIARRHRKQGPDVVDRNVLRVYVDLSGDATDRLLIDFAARYEDYSDFGGELTGKIAALYRISDRLRLRGAISNSFRAPALQQIGFSDTTLNFGVDRLLVHTRTLPVSDAIARALGARDLDPEASLNLSFGGSAELADHLSLAVDLFRTDVQDRITLSDRFFGARGLRSSTARRGRRSIRSLLHQRHRYGNRGRRHYPRLPARPVGRRIRSLGRFHLRANGHFRLRANVTEAFSVEEPILERDLLAGRKEQIEQLVDSVRRRGSHAVIYGEPGAGKTSVANTFHLGLNSRTRPAYFIKVHADPGDTYTSLWRRIFKRLTAESKEDGRKVTATKRPLSDDYKGDITIDDVREELSNFGENATPIVVIDEFNLVKDREVNAQIATTIKGMSDYGINCTLVLVGVARNVSDLVKNPPLHRPPAHSGEDAAHEAGGVGAYYLAPPPAFGNADDARRPLAGGGPIERAPFFYARNRDARSARGGSPKD